MSTRRSHPKSRRGCIPCKSSHVRCDEKGPPCGRCQIRGTECRYASPSTRQSDSSPAESTATSAETASPAAGDLTRTGEVRFPPTRHLLELQLMHRWSALTYKSCCSPGSDDDEVWQYLVPRLAIQHGFLLHGLFALTAFETAKTTKTPDGQMYINQAIEYHGLALGEFQSELPAINTDTHEAALCMSLLLLCLALASAQAAPGRATGERGPMVHAVITHFELLRGCVPVLEIKPDYVATNVHIRKVKRFEDLPRKSMDPVLEEAFAKLGDLNDKRITATVRDVDEERVKQVTHWTSCKRALATLRDCYERCIDDFSRGYVLGFPNLAGEGYIRAIEEEDSVALLILMYWGVLTQRLAYNVWWAEDFGGLLVAEIAGHISLDDDDTESSYLIRQAKILVAQSPS